jgi:hypothetical protein
MLNELKHDQIPLFIEWNPKMRAQGESGRSRTASIRRNPTLRGLSIESDPIDPSIYQQKVAS